MRSELWIVQEITKEIVGNIGAVRKPPPIFKRVKLARIQAVRDALSRGVSDLPDDTRVTLIDCDSMQVPGDGGAVFRCPVGKPEYTPHVDTGDFIVVVNASKLRVTGNKALDKKYYRHSGYPGGVYETNFARIQAQFPERVLEKAVKGMLPKGPLGYAMLKKLKVYAADSHPHTAQQPKALEV